jgi:hypothetical protein
VVLGGVVSVLERFGPFDEERDRRTFRDRAVPNATPDNENLSRPEIDGRQPLELDSELPLPAKEDLVFEVRVPLERAVQLRDANNSVVRASNLGRFPRLGDAAGGQSDVDLTRAYLAYSTARVSRMTVILI